MAIPVSGLCTISEFSNYVGISKASLRYYDEIGLLKPLKRGLTNSNKNRYYSNNQLAEGRMIRIFTEKRIILDDANITDDSDDLLTAISKFCASPHDPAVNVAMPIGNYFKSMEDFQKNQLKPTRLFAIDPSGNEKWTAGLYMVGYARGPYNTPNDLPSRMITYAKDNGLSFTGPVYNIHLLNEISVADPAQYLLKAFVSVKETQKKYNRMLFSESEKKSSKK